MRKAKFQLALRLSSRSQRFLIRILHSDGSAQIDLASLASPERKTILAKTYSGPAVAPASNGKTYLLYLDNGALMGQEFDEKAATLSGSPFRVVDQVGGAGRRQGLPTASAAADVLAYQTGTNEVSYQSAWYDRSGKVLKQLPAGSGGLDLTLSPDGRFAAFDKDAGTTSDIWVLSLGDGSSTRLTFAGKGQIYSNPAWSPDGNPARESDYWL